MSAEACTRCGEVEYDRRTLWMACFYAMEELGLPFVQQTLFHADVETLTPAKAPTTIDLPPKPDEPAQRIVIAPGAVRSTGELTPQGLYTLRVCKECRSDWMHAIKAWWSTPKGERRGVGSGIFVRDNGANREVTLEEWERLRALRGGR